MARVGPVYAGALLLSWCLLGEYGVAGDVTHSRAATVALTVPYATILRDEVVQLTVRLRNNSKQNLHYIPDPRDVAGTQVFIKVERGDASYTGPWHVDGSAEFPGSRIRTVERDGRWDAVVKKATALLRPGETVEWDGSRFDERLFFVAEGRPKSIRAQVLIGPGQWVTSEPVTIKVIERDTSRAPVVFENVYMRPHGAARPMRIRRVAIDGKQYLFSGAERARGRICEVPTGATPKFEWDPRTALLTVRFAGVDAPPVRYNYKMMQRLPGKDSHEPSAGAKGKER